MHFTYREELRLHDEVMRAILGRGTLRCTVPRQEELRPGFYDDCLDHFEILAKLVASGQIEALPDDMFDVRNVHEDRTTNISFLEFRRRLAEVGTTP